MRSWLKAGLIAALFVPLCPTLTTAEQQTGNGQWVTVDMGRFYIAVDYLDRGAGPKVHAVIQQFFDLKIPFITLPKGNVNDRYDPKLDVVLWNPSVALQVASDSGLGTGKYISPALLLLDAIADAVAHARSAPGYDNLAASSDPLFGTLEQRRVIAGLSRSDADPKLHDQAATAVAGADQIRISLEGNGLENAVAGALGEPVRTNSLLVRQGNDAVEGVT